jgi:uncharacterized Zn finger protein
MLYIEVGTARELRQEFISYDRDYYSFEAYELMLDYFENEIIELDIIALCGFFNEDTIDEIINNYNIEIEEEENKADEVLEYLNSNTWAVKTSNNTILYTEF